MKTTAKDPHTRLTTYLESAPRLVGPGAAVELTAAGVVVLLDGAATETSAHALFDFWTDFGSGQPLQARVTLAALLRSLELWRSIPAGGHVDRHVVDALDRMFAAIHADPARLSETVPPDAEDALVEGLSSHVERLSSSATPLPGMEMNWVTLSSSMVAAWPTSFDRAMAPLLHGSPTTWRSSLRYLVCVAYPTLENPWANEPFLVWDRFGAEDAVTWTTETANRLKEALSAERVAKLVERIIELSAGQDESERREVATVCEEILVLRLDDDFAIRRRIVIEKLLTPHPGRFWDDEYG